MDVGTGLALLGSAKLVEKLLGPTAEYIGEGVKHWTEKRVNNVNRIFDNAAKQLGDKINEEGSVPPKVLKGILDEGSFCDDELGAEYFGGVLASSRTSVSRDDRGATYIALLGRLSTYQIRSHYVFYHIVKKLFDGIDTEVRDLIRREAMETIIPLQVYEKAIGLSENENIKTIAAHVMSGLAREILISERIGLGSGKLLRAPVQHLIFDTTEDGHISGLRDGGIGEFLALGFTPTIPGVELFLWAHGKSDLGYEDFFSSSNQITVDEGVIIPPGYYKAIRK